MRSMPYTEPMMKKVLLSFIVHVSEVAALLDSSRTVGRINPCCLVGSDIVVMGLGIGGFVMILMSDYGYGNAPTGFPRPWDTTRFIAAWLLIAIV